MVAMLAAPLTSLPSQSAADHALLAAAADAVGRDTVHGGGRARDPVAQQLQVGFAELDRYIKSRDRQAVERALFRFNSAALRQPSWAWPEYAMAHAFLILHDFRAPLLPSEGSREGEAYLEAMWRHLLEALRRDASLSRARMLLADLAYASGDRELRDDTEAALLIEVSRRDARADALIVWARHQRALRNYEVTLAILGQAAAAGADHDVVALEQARTLMALGRPREAGREYWRGVDTPTRRGRDLYRQDLGWVLDPDSLSAFDSVAAGGEDSWLRRFWGERDAAAAAEPGSRVLEHLRRWVVAHERYRIPAPWRRNMFARVDVAFDDVRDQCVGSATDYYNRLPVHPPALLGDVRTSEPLLDHRGMIYLRHGEPLAYAVPPAVVEDAADRGAAAGINPGQEGVRLQESLGSTEVWVYWVEGSYRVLSFRGSDALGKHAATTLASYLPWQAAQAWEALAALLPGFRRAATEISFNSITPPSCRPAVTAAIRQHRVDANVGIDTDSDTPPLTTAWNAPLRTFGLGGVSDRSGRALISFAIPVRALRADTLADGSTLWPLDFRIVAYRPSDGRRVDMDSTRRFSAIGAPANGHLSGHFELPLDDGTWQLAMLVRQRGDSTTGAYTLRRGLVIGGSGPLSLGDIVTGRSGQPPWRAPDGPFPVNTLGTWVEGGTVELWYEVRGVNEGDTYRTTIEVIPSERRLGEPVRVATDDRASGRVTRVRKAIGLDRLEPGVYRLVVTVEHAGARAAREQEILVVEGSR